MGEQLFFYSEYLQTYLPHSSRNSLANDNRRKQVTPKPEDQKEQQITEMQKSTQSAHQENLPGKI